VAINDYATLQAAAASWLTRADLTASIPDFISLAEARFNRELRVRQMQASATGTISAGVLALPADCREIQSLRVNLGNVYVELPPLPPEALQEILPVTAYPVGYVVVNGNVQLIGYQADIEYQLTYWQTIPALSAGQNWLILRHPDVYLYGTLAQSAPFLRDDERLVTWGTLYKSAIDQVEAEDGRARYGNAPRQQPAMRFTP
jgi:hypothetical protein